MRDMVMSNWAQVAPPAYLPTPGPQGRYIQGHGMAVVHTSLGTLTAFQPDGHMAWQVRPPQCLSRRCTAHLMCRNVQHHLVRALQLLVA